MSDNALDTLFLPFEKDILTPPVGRTVFFGARAHGALKSFGAVQGVQAFHPHHAGMGMPDWDGAGAADMALVLLPKQKEEAQHDLALAFETLKPGGVIVAAAANDAGGTRIEGWMTELGLSPQAMPKNKARVCWAIKHDDSAAAGVWIEAGAPRTLTIDGQDWMTQPGVFGWNRADAGSQLLIQCLPDGLRGLGADFGCGYGYLARAVLAQNPGIDTLLCIDADRRAVECCAANVPDPRAAVIWGDLSVPPEAMGDLDFIVMNPPFHEGKTTVPALGQAFIGSAQAALKPGGWLYMVANAKLDYESVLKAQFRHGDKLAETGGFKVYRAQK